MLKTENSFGSVIQFINFSDPYVKLFFFNQSGRLVKKKKSAIKYDTKEPFFDETIHFEVRGFKKNKKMSLSFLFVYFVLRNNVNLFMEKLERNFSLQIFAFVILFLL